MYSAYNYLFDHHGLNNEWLVDTCLMQFGLHFNHIMDLDKHIRSSNQASKKTDFNVHMVGLTPITKTRLYFIKKSYLQMLSMYKKQTN